MKYNLSSKKCSSFLKYICCFVGYSGDRVQRPMKESQENQQNAETQRERYYATIHKVALQQANSGGPEKIPGESLLRYGRKTGLVLLFYR